MSRRLALCQVQAAYGPNVYLPLAVGCLWAHARGQDGVRGEWTDPVFLYRKEAVSKALARLGSPLPDLVAFSCYIWNWEWNRALARAIKEVSLDTTVVYGGVHIPDRPDTAWFDTHSECDFLIHGEGEHSFTTFLREWVASRNWDKVPGLSLRGLSTPRRFGPLDELHSPYLDGVFNSILNESPRWQILQESNRGCPFLCTFCEWGSAALNKIRPFPMDRILAEIDWFGRNKVDYCDNADANFGILERDERIAEAFVKTKERYGFPEKFRTSFAKYTNAQIAERVFRIAKVLHRSGQLKAVTLALQSTNEPTLVEIKRKNIAMDGFKELQDRYRAEGIPTYTELILGLPGETYDSFRAGLDRVLDSGQHENLFVYTCTVLPNSEMADPVYVHRHGLRSVRMRAMLSHGTPTPDAPDEWQDTVVETGTLSHTSWRRLYLYSWLVQVLHSFGLTRWWAQQERERRSYTSFYDGLERFALARPWSVLGRALGKAEGLLVQALEGGSWDNVLPRFGDNSWPPDEGGFLEIVSELDRFYGELEQNCNMPPQQRECGPPPIPPGREVEYARQVWYGRRGDFLEGLRKVVGEEMDNA